MVPRRHLNWYLKIMIYNQIIKFIKLGDTQGDTRRALLADVDALIAH